MSFRSARNVALFVGAALGTLALQAAAAHATSILFVGNSFTYGEPAGGAPIVEYYQPSTVTDLNGGGIGGVPALFKQLTVEAGLNYTVSLETVPGVGLDYHYNNKLSELVTQPYDVAILQGYSTLDPVNPGNPANQIKFSALLGQALAAQNPDINVLLDATWTRADQTYLPSGHWYGQPIDAMEQAVQAGDVQADNQSNLIDGVIPVGGAFNEAIQTGFADADPYNGIDPGKINIWAPDSYHASPYGYYLEALTEFYSVTGENPDMFGANDPLASGIGLTPAQATLLQQFAAGAPLLVPEPTSVAGLAVGLLGLMWMRRRA